MTRSDIPEQVRAAYRIEGQAERIAIGLVNETYLAHDRGGAPLIVQRLHPAFGAEVHFDMEAVSAFVGDACARSGQPPILPALRKTIEGALWFEVSTKPERDVWRALHYMPGRTLAKVSSATTAFEAGRIAGVFHQKTVDLMHVFRHVRPGVHDLAQHLGRLQQAVNASLDDEASADVVRSGAIELAKQIVAEAHALPKIDFSQQPQRIIHGDLKISNLRFAEHEERAVGLLDLDTFQRGFLLHEIGDALRSWCNQDAEDGARTKVDLALCEAALRGYRAGNPDVQMVEWNALTDGLEIIALELASRFCLDVFEDRYFGWDSARYSSRREHNFVRAESQLRLSLDARAQRDDLRKILDNSRNQKIA